MHDSAAYARPMERIMRICATFADARSLRLELLSEIRRTVAFDYFVWLLTDPETSVGVAPLADVPALSDLARLIRLKYRTRIIRWTALNTAASFTKEEAEFLAGLTGPVTTAIRRAQAESLGLPAQRRRRLGPVVLLLSPDLDVLAQTPQTQEFLRVLVPPAQDRAPIRASAYNVGAQLITFEAGVDPNPPWARVHLAKGVWVTLRAPGSAAPNGRALAVSR